MTAEQSRFGPRAAPAGVRHAGRPAGPRAVCGVCGGRADPGAQSAAPGARPGRRASAPQVARLGVEKRLLRGAAGRAQRRAAPGAAPAGPAPGPRGGGGVAAAGGAHGGVLGVSGPPGRAARLKSGQGRGTRGDPSPMACPDGRIWDHIRTSGAPDVWHVNPRGGVY